MIHQSAIISSKANIANNVKIGPYCVVDSEVTIEEGNKFISIALIDQQ